MIGIKFGDFDMQADGVQVIDTDVYSSPPNSIQSDQLPNADGAVIVKQQYTSKSIMVDGNLITDDISSLDSLLDDFKAAMNVKNQALDVDYADGTRRWLCNAQNVMISRSGPSVAGYSIQFLSPDGMGWDLDTTVLLSSTSITTAISSTAITVGGTYKCEPLITVTLSTLTGSGSHKVTISNGVTLRGMSISRTWSAGDVIEIDSLKKTVFVNNTIVEFSGQFPVWDIGAGTITYLDDLTARNASITASYTKRWL